MQIQLMYNITEAIYGCFEIIGYVSVWSNIYCIQEFLSFGLL